MEYGQDRFKIPVSFPISSCQDIGQKNKPNTQWLLDSTFATSRPTVIEYWHETASTGGIIVGCALGSIYMFHCLSEMNPHLPASQLEESTDPVIVKTPRRKPRRSFNTSGSNSPGPSNLVLSPTLNVTPKPRVVSGVTTEQVEAPKNYVDFEDEPDKLKDILKGRAPRDKSVTTDPNTERAPKSNAPSVIEPVPLSKRKNMLSAANSRAPTPPISTPSSSSPNSDMWVLKYHTIPTRSGSGHAVKSIQLLPDAQHFAVLQESGDIHIYSFKDGSCKASFQVDVESQDHVSKFERKRPSDIWTWCHLTVSEVGEHTKLIATAASGGEFLPLASIPETDFSETSKYLLLEFSSNSSGLYLKKLGQWELEGPAVAGTLYAETDGSLGLITASGDGHLIVQNVIPSPTKEIIGGSQSNGNHAHGHLSIPHAIKSIISGSTEHLPSNENASTYHVKEPSASLSESRDVGALVDGARPLGMITRNRDARSLQGIVWFNQEVTVFDCEEGLMRYALRYPAVNVRAASWLDDDRFALNFKNRIELYTLKRVNTHDKPQNELNASSIGLRLELIRSLTIDRYDTIRVTNDLVIFSKLSTETNRREIMSYPLLRSKAAQGAPDISRLIWRFDNGDQGVLPTFILPIDSENFVLGYSDGHLREYSLLQLSRKTANALTISPSKKISSLPACCEIVGLHIVQNPRTREKYLVGGGDDGSIMFWSLSTFGLLARWITFVTPLSKVIQPEVEKSSPLRGCALCISGDGTIAVIVIDGFYFLYLVPGYVSPLTRICLGGKSLLLIYADRRARLWNSQTKEFWRSMDQDKAEEMLAQDGWTNMSLYKDASIPKSVWSSISDSYDGLDAAASLLLDLEQLVVDSISVTKTISTSKDEVREILMTLDRLKIVLSFFITPGLSEDIDSICYGKLGAYTSTAIPGLASNVATTLYAILRPTDVWCISDEVTATRALAVIAVLRAMSLFEELTAAANTVIAFYTEDLAARVGSGFKNPSLEVLGTRWFQASNELRPAIRTLFDATIAGLSDETAIEMTDKWQHHVPALQPDAEKESHMASLALLICGNIASEKYSLLSVNTLTDISKSISFYLHDENSIYRVLAIDLCSRGFHVWQHYVDAMEILRSLFNIATNSRKDSISIQNSGAQARLAILSITSNDMPFLMSTLCLDILGPPTMEHRRSVLQVLAFLIRKRPFVLQPHLPRLMEAVVKSLDPNATGNREMVLDAATEIISYVVKTYPTVCFHTNSQRLAVGTNEGAVVMYDLKTAIRLYVLEGHKKAISACSFSPDGRRLITLCLKESNVLVWKVGSSFASFFTPGAPPRQGHGGSEAFKTLNFHIGSDVEMTTAETLELIHIEWITDRNVKVRIRQSVLTFST